jgi:GNAT superfamily N-acetyltransferase
VRRQLAGGYELDDDRGRIDVDVVHRYLSEESYWARGRPAQEVQRLVKEATRVIGIYAPDGSQAAFCRIASDGAAFAFLADVFVLEGHRGRRLGRELVAEAVERGPQSDLRWFLGTNDAHGLYAEYGFGRPSERIMERPPRTTRRPG